MPALHSVHIWNSLVFIYFLVFYSLMFLGFLFYRILSFESDFLLWFSCTCLCCVCFFNVFLNFHVCKKQLEGKAGYMVSDIW